TGSSGGDLEHHWLPQTLKEIRDSIKIDLPSINIVPAKRKIGESNSDFTDYSGNGLISQLAAIQNPSHSKQSDRILFDKINKFVQSVTDRSDAQIEIPHDRAHVLVHMNDRVLPLSSLGTGIEEVIMIAAFCTLSRG